MKKYVAEFIGTFFLVLTVGCTVIPGAAGVIAPLAIGGALMVMVYATGHISGGHLNPAVTLAVFIRGRCDAKDVIPYWVAQLLAGVAAAFVAVFLVGKSGTPMEIKNVPAAFVSQGSLHLRAGLRGRELRDCKRHFRQFILRVGHRHDRRGRCVRRRRNLRRRVLIPRSRSALAVMKLVNFADIWIHIVAEFAGAIRAALAFKFLNPTDK